MSSNSGISDGDFDRLLISTDLAVGQDQDFGTSGKVLTSAGEGGNLFWGTNSATLPEKLIKGDNILFKNPSDVEVPDYNGSVATTITLESEVDINEIKTNKITLPKVGTTLIELDGSTGIIETTSVGEVLSIKNGGDIKLYSDSGGNNTLFIDGNNGAISMGSQGKLQTTGVDEIMRVNNGGVINLYDDNVGVSKTIELDGEEGRIIGKTLLLNGKSGTDTAVFDGNVRINISSNQDGDLTIAGDTSSLNGNLTLTNGTITAGGLISGGSLTTAGNITATGTGAGFVGVGTDGDSYKILLEKDGTITCDDLEVENHTGTINFANIDTNSLSIPIGEAKTCILNTAGLLISGNKPDGFSGAGSGITCSNIRMVGTHGAISCFCEGDLQIISSSGDTAQNGDLTLSTGDLTITAGELEVVAGNSVFRGGADFIGTNSVNVVDGSGTLQFRLNPTTGDFTATTGDITATAGDIVATAGDITATAGSLTSNRIGSKPAPSDGTYTEWGLNLSDTNTHGYIGGNLIVNGTIFGDVQGNITEEEIDCQRITCRTATPPLAGITGMILGTGAVISNDTTGIYELTIDADTSSILCNNLSLLNNTSGDQALSVLGNVTLSSGSTRTTTIGNVGNSGQTLEVLCNNVNLGETAGNQQNNILNYRGGVHTFTGEKINIGNRLGFTNVGCSIEGTMGQGADNIYRNNVKFLNLDGQHISHTLAGTIQNFVVLRANAERTIQIAKQVGFANTSTVFTLPDTYFFENKVAHTSVAKLDFDLFFRHRSGTPDLYVRVDSTSAGATPYNSTDLKPRILVNTAFGGAGNEIRVTHSYFIEGLIPGDTYSFYPKFADTTSGSAIGDLKYGGAFGEMSLKLTWLEAYLGVSGDPYVPGDDY